MNRKSKPKIKLQATKLVEMEIEKYYPYVTRLKKQIQSVTTSSEKSQYFSVLQKAESYICKEVSKLRSKPNRATKYTTFMRRLISCMRLMLNYLNENDELEALPTLAVIACHYVNILLASSVKNRDLPKNTASSSYSFLKMLFDREVEFVLDVLICSNVPDDAMQANSVGYYMLAEVLRDPHLFVQDSSTFVKFCTVASLLKDCKNGSEVVKSATADVDSYPSDLKAHIEMKYGFPRKVRFSVSAVIENIQPRKVISITRMERLLVSSPSGQKPKENKSSKVEANCSSSISTSKSMTRVSNTNNSKFFYDIKGCYVDEGESMEVTSTFPTIEIESEENQQEDVRSESDEINDNDDGDVAKSGSESEIGGYGFAIGSDVEIVSIDSEDMQDMDFSQELGSTTTRQPPFEEMYERRKSSSIVVSSSDFRFGKCNLSYTPADSDDEKESIHSREDHESDSVEVMEPYHQNDTIQNDMTSDEDDAKSDSTLPNVAGPPIVSPLKKVTEERLNPTVNLTQVNESDDELEVIFDDINFKEPQEEERDLAEPESGEDEVPYYGEEELEEPAVAKQSKIYPMDEAGLSEPEPTQPKEPSKTRMETYGQVEAEKQSTRPTKIPSIVNESINKLTPQKDLTKGRKETTSQETLIEPKVSRQAKTSTKAKDITAPNKSTPKTEFAKTRTGVNNKRKLEEPIATKRSKSSPKNEASLNKKESTKTMIEPISQIISKELTATKRDEISPKDQAGLIKNTPTKVLTKNRITRMGTISQSTLKQPTAAKRSKATPKDKTVLNKSSAQNELAQTLMETRRSARLARKV